MRVYIFLISTGEVVAKLDEDKEENFMDSLIAAMPTEAYDFRLENRMER